MRLSFRPFIFRCLIRELTDDYDRRSTALGAALMAGAALKLFGWNLSAPATLSKVNTAGVKSFKPTLGFEEREKKYAGWNRAVERASKWKLDE